jgi:hypothetical protein
MPGVQNAVRLAICVVCQAVIGGFDPPENLPMTVLTVTNFR